jgi:hypothetical protein
MGGYLGGCRLGKKAEKILNKRLIFLCVGVG